MTMAKKKRSAVISEIRALLSRIDDISQQTWDKLDQLDQIDSYLLTARNMLKAIIHKSAAGDN